MKLKNISVVDATFTLKGEAGREIKTISPGGIFEVPTIEGINLCKARGRTFAPADKDSQTILEDTYEKPEMATVKRKMTGTEDQANKDIEEGKKKE